MAEISQIQLAREWLKILLDREKELFAKHKVSTARQILINSFDGTVIPKNEEQVERIYIKFLFYLRYLDMGVGRGVPIGSRAAYADYYKHRNSRGQLHQYRRKAKPLYNKPFTSQIKRLTELVGENFGIKAITALEGINKFEDVTISID